MKTTLTLTVIALASAAIVSCGGGGKYNFDVKYHPLKAEKSFFGEMEEINYVEVKNDPLKYRGAKLGWFGVVKDYGDNKDGSMTLLMEYRSYQPRHLCEDNLVKSSCRVTVSLKSHGTFTTTLKPAKEDADGKSRINYKSLLRIYGTPTGDYDDEGGPVLTCDFYRHWPPGTYVTTAASKVLLQ